jgi:hypothetical protein
MTRRQIVQPWLWSLFGVVAATTVLASAGCDPAHAQTVTPIPYQCREEVLIADCGEDWHICYFLRGCWLLDTTPAGTVAHAPVPARLRLAVR